MKELNKLEKGKANKVVKAVGNSFMKSPSDTTINAPAFMKSPLNTDMLVCNKPQQVVDSQHLQYPVGQADEANMDNMISNFVDKMRIKQRGAEDALREKKRCLSSQGKEQNPGLAEAMDRAGKVVIEAEKFRASIADPDPGMLAINDVIPNIGSRVSDDDFFHLTCHIDPNLTHKIEKGEFVELEKLLPKDKLGRNEESRLEWVQHDGGLSLFLLKRI